MWEGNSAESDIRAVWASKVPDPEWSWRIDVAAMEFVRDDPLEAELRAALAAALGEVSGVTSVVEEDREVWLVAGIPSGEELMIASTRVIDAVADRVHRSV